MLTFTCAGDEAGDVSLNFGKGASRYYVPAFIGTQSPDSLRETLANLRQRLGLYVTHELKFHKMTSPEIRRQVFSVLAYTDFEARAILVDKSTLPKIFHTIESITIYTHFISELLTIIPSRLQRDATFLLLKISMYASHISGLSWLTPSWLVGAGTRGRLSKKLEIR